MRILILILLVVLIIAIVLGANEYRAKGQDRLFSRYFMLSLAIIFLTIGAFFQPELKKRIQEIRNKLNSSL
jgi:uncharacterized membrane protein YczE